MKLSKTSHDEFFVDDYGKYGHCTECGNIVYPSDAFCTHCGKRIDKADFGDICVFRGEEQSFWLNLVAFLEPICGGIVAACINKEMPRRSKGMISWASVGLAVRVGIAILISATVVHNFKDGKYTNNQNISINESSSNKTVEDTEILTTIEIIEGPSKRSSVGDYTYYTTVIKNPEDTEMDGNVILMFYDDNRRVFESYETVNHLLPGEEMVIQSKTDSDEVPNKVVICTTY